jgi:hypothetical protein
MSPIKKADFKESTVKLKHPFVKKGFHLLFQETRSKRNC